jgi:hypothetical protein
VSREAFERRPIVRRYPGRLGRLFSLAVAGALALAVAGPVSAADEAMVRVLHASPDAPQVDVFVDGTKVDPLSGLEFGDLTDYVAVPGGTYAIKVCASADDTICPIDVPALDIAANTHYTIAATNDLASIEAQVLVDDPSPEADKAQVRVAHFSADTPAVDVLTQDGATKVVENLSYPTATDYLSLDPGSYDLKVCANADNTVCPLDPGALDLAGGTSYTVFAVGSLSGDTLTAVVGVDAVAASSAPESTSAPTPPPTDTVVAGDVGGGSDSGIPAMAMLLALAGLAFVTSRRVFARAEARD